ncbi:MAG: TRAP transporter substrate-binding protein [Treponema sp.]|jgi:tripartite ATP-independent transporter DctP family solute receptor|nr:TRAP transporter substrate-binding protein [Treponema sp.]
MTKRIAVFAVILLSITILAGCKKSEQKPAAAIQVTKDRSAFSTSLATPLSAEDAAIDITAKSNNPNKVIFRYGTVIRNLDESPPARANRQFLIELKKRLGDKIEIQLYFGGVMGTSADQIIGGLQARSYECSDHNIGAFAEYTNAFMPLDVMYLIPDADAGIAVSEGEPGELMRQKCIEDTGLNPLFYTCIGMRYITNTKRPIRTPNDMQGLKIRVQNNPLHILALRQLGAAPTPIAYAELFTALQQKVVDGQENPVANIYDQNYGEVQDYLTISNHLYTAGTATVNNRWLLEQSEEVQQAIYESAKIGEAYTAMETLKVENKLLEELGKMMEIYQLSPDEFKQFQDISKQTWDQAAQRIGKEYFEKVRISIERTLASM